MEQVAIQWFVQEGSLHPDGFDPARSCVVFLPDGGHWIKEGDFVFLPLLFREHSNLSSCIDSLRVKKISGFCILARTESEIPPGVEEYARNSTIPGGYACIDRIRNSLTGSFLIEQLKYNLLEFSRNKEYSLDNIIKMIDFSLGTETEILTHSFAPLLSSRRETAKAPDRKEPPFYDWAREIRNLLNQKMKFYTPGQFSFDHDYFFGFPLLVRTSCQGYIFFKAGPVLSIAEAEKLNDILPFILMSFTAEVYRNVNSRRQLEDFIRGVLFGFYNNDSTLAREADLYHIPYNLNRFVWILRLFPGQTSLDNYSIPQIFVHRITSIITSCFPHEICLYDQTQIICIHTKDSESDESLKRKYHNLIRKTEDTILGFDCVIGVSRAYKSLYDLKNAYKDALFSVRMGTLIFKRTKKFYSYDDLLIYHLLYDQVDNPILHRLYTNSIKTIALHDEKKGDRLQDTVRALIKTNYNIKETSATLNIHRNTLYQRLDKIQELLGFSLKTSEGRLVLQLGEAMDSIMKDYLKKS